VRFALEVRHGRSEIEEFSERLIAAIDRSGGEVLSDEDSEPDMVLAVGGDGTMLAAVHRSLAWDVPVLGFNLGTLGFLTAAEPDDLEKVVERLIVGDYETQERTTVRAAIGESSAVGINDVVVEKIDSTRLISLDVNIDGEHFFNYRADGLIIATPTGSTAYSFSAGGPLVDPEVGGLVLTPVASHSLFDRALVIPDTSEIDIGVSRDRSVRVNVDKGSLGVLEEGDSVNIRRGGLPARFVTLDPVSFAGLVRDKFGLS
jgi:NAD+ kinase